MQRIDAHQHFWNFHPVRDSWITEEMSVLKRDFLPGDLKTILKDNGFHGCVAVQADQSELENSFLLSCAEANDFIKGIVGWVDLQSAAVEERLEHHSQFQKMKGFRHILQGEAQRDLMLTDVFKRGISLLQKFSFTYDILIFPDQLPYIKQLVAEFPDQKFVIDHLAKPYIKKREIDEWKDDIEAVAAYENVYCKISGLVTEADWAQWKQQDMRPYLDVVVNAFGPHRLMFGSDWPVCLLAGLYNEVVQMVEFYFAPFTKHEQDLVFGQNAIEFYNLGADGPST